MSEDAIAEGALPHPGEEEPFLYGVIAEFGEAEEVVAAARRARAEGYRNVDAYTPFPVEGLSDALGFRDAWIPAIILAGGFLGFLAGYGLIYYGTVISYPLNIGGRPLHGWPAYIPIAFECTILGAALAGVVGMCVLNRLPMPYHPVFDAPGFAEATSSRFFLCIEAVDPRFDRRGTRGFMETLGAARVSEVELRK